MLRAFIVVAFFGCGGAGGSSLKGSVTESFDLDYSKVVMSRDKDYFVLEYQKENGAKTVKLVVYVADKVITANSTVDLAGMVNNSPRATLQRIVEATIDIGVQSGSITFDQPPDAGTAISGKFNTLTAMPAGHTLNGTFSGTVQER